jgi:hypothetical protein
MRNESISIVWHEGLERLVVDVLRRRIRSTQTTGTGTTYWTGRRRTSSSAPNNLAFLDYHTIHDASRMSVHDAYIAYGTPELWLLKSKQKRKRKTVGRTWDTCGPPLVWSCLFLTTSTIYLIAFLFWKGYLSDSCIAVSSTYSRGITPTFSSVLKIFTSSD